jgi:hypothetical protein
MKPGTQLIRRWKGQTITVTVLEDGFTWEGRIYNSLSALAKAVTGTSWSGQKFFGVRRANRSNKNAAGPVGNRLWLTYPHGWNRTMGKAVARQRFCVVRSTPANPPKRDWSRISTRSMRNGVLRRI